MGKIRQLVLAGSSQSAHNHHGIQNPADSDCVRRPHGEQPVHKKEDQGGRRGGQED